MEPSQVKCLIRVNEGLRSQAEKIYEQAEEQEADLLIIGAKGQTSVVTSLLGNVTENLRRKKKEIPIMIMKNVKKEQ